MFIGSAERIGAKLACISPLTDRQRARLPRSCGRSPASGRISARYTVDPKAIRKTALLTVDGERDDICGLGQTMAAQDLCASIRL